MYPRSLVPALALLAGLGAAESSGPQLLSPVDDELTMFQDLPVVISGSRRASRLTESPVAMSVVTADDLRYGGYDDFAEALYFVPGVDVQYADKNHPMVGVRGLQDSYSDRTLVLLDGQVAEHPVYGGAEWQRLPITSSDISRIEVVRGPGAAAWGGNAFNGVINIISKTPEECFGSTVSGGVTAEGDLDAGLRWADLAGPLRWRMSLAGQSRDDAQATGGGDGANAYDDFRGLVGNGECDWELAPTSSLILRVGYSQQEQGSLVLLNVPNPDSAEQRTLMGAVQLQQTLSPLLHLSIGTSYTEYASLDPASTDQTSRENGYSAQFDADMPAGHQLSIGGDTRYTRVAFHDTTNPNYYQIVENPLDEYRAGMYVIDRWTVNRRLTLEGQLRGDTYSGTGSDWSGRLAALIAADDDHQHILRLATARAYRAAMAGFRSTSADRIPVAIPFPPFSIPAVLYRGNPDLDTEQTWTAEIGWSSNLGPWSLRWDTYYQHYHDLFGYGFSNTAIPGQLLVTPQALGSAAGYGVECETGWSSAASGISIWYAWNAFVPEEEDQSVRAYHPSEQKVGLRSRWNLRPDLIAIANYRYSTSAESSALNVPDSAAYHRLDLAVTWLVVRGAGLTIGCHDVTDDAPPQGSQSQLGNNPAPGRTAFLRGDWTF